jgi:dCMP deaminase
MEDGIFPKLKFVNFYMTTAHTCAQLSYAQRLQVGAVIVKDNRIISYGYNGTPAGYDNKCEDEEGKTKKEVLHAEANALMKAASSHESTEDAGLYLTHSPCMDCAKMILQSRIKYVVFNEQYRDNKGIKFLQDAGTSVVRWSDLIGAKQNGLME